MANLDAACMRAMIVMSNKAFGYPCKGELLLDHGKGVEIQEEPELS